MLAEDSVLAIRIDSVVNPPWGTAGGKSGGTARAIINPGRNSEVVLAPLSDGNKLRKGDVLRIETGGGGGRGHPFDRSPHAVLRDVLEGYVSIAAALRDYGVVIAEGGLDMPATLAIRNDRPAAANFHRMDYVDELV